MEDENREKRTVGAMALTVACLLLSADLVGYVYAKSMSDGFAGADTLGIFAFVSLIICVFGILCTLGEILRRANEYQCGCVPAHLAFTIFGGVSLPGLLLNSRFFSAG